jgi:hypothetical protein
MDDLARAKAEARQARRLADTFPDNRTYQDCAFHAARKLAEMRAQDDFASNQRDDDRLNVIEARLDAIEQRLDEIDSRTRVAIAEAVKGLCDELNVGFAQPLGEMLKRELGELERKLGHLEQLWRTVPKLSDPAPPRSMHDFN